MTLPHGHLKGKSASPGIVVGPVLIVEHEALAINRAQSVDTKAEVTRLHRAIDTAKADLERVRLRVHQEIGPDKAQIFESHILMLEDPELIATTEQKIQDEGCNADYALKEVANYFVATFEAMEDEYLRERAADVRDVTDRVLRLLQGKRVVSLADLSEDVVLVAHDLTPSDTATMNKKHVLGILTNIGGKTSHTAIMARTLEIPAVLGLKRITQDLKNGDIVAFDGETGEVILHPDQATINEYRAKKAEYDRIHRDLVAQVGLPSETTDGCRVALEGNIGTTKDLPSLKAYDAEGVGLYRTEFLFMDRADMPSELEQFEAYKTVLEALGTKPCIIRTLDIGGDKDIPYLQISKEDNPFLGLRAIRYCLANVDVFKIQLRALLRASVFGNLGIMFPMIASVDEVIRAKSILEEVRAELSGRNVPVASNIRIGIMIEIPSAAIVSDALAKHVDFFSIGTNDLIQYTLAVDRLNENVADIYDPYHPGVLRLINTVIQSGRRAGIKVGMCGEMAGMPDLIPVLVGMGLHEFSMAPTSILRARSVVRKLSLERAKELAERVLACGSSDEVRSVVS